MAIEGGSKLIKFIFVFFNLIVTLGGLAMIVVGVLSLVKPDAAKMIPLIGSQMFQTAAILCIVIGCIVFLLGFLGCCGAIKESKCMLGSFFAILLIITIAVLAVAILAFVFKGKAEEEIKKGLIETLTTKYKNVTGNSVDDTADKSIQEGWDFIQQKFSCCGIENGTSKVGYPIWLQSYWTMENKKVATDANYMYVPPSCCKKDSNIQVCTGQTNKVGAAPRNGTADTNNDANPNLNYEGCYDSIKSEIDQNIAIVGGVCIGIFLLMILAMIFSMCLCRQIDSE